MDPTFGLLDVPCKFVQQIIRHQHIHIYGVYKKWIYIYIIYAISYIDFAIFPFTTCRIFLAGWLYPGRCRTQCIHWISSEGGLFNDGLARLMDKSGNKSTWKRIKKSRKWVSYGKLSWCALTWCSLRSGGAMGFISDFRKGILRVAFQRHKRRISVPISFSPFFKGPSPGYSAERGPWSLVPGPWEYPLARRALQRLLLARRRSGSWSLPTTWCLAIEIHGYPQRRVAPSQGLKVKRDWGIWLYMGALVDY
jgi:hypothetical protein